MTTGRQPQGGDARAQGKGMENRKQETENWKLINLSVFHLRFSVSCFPFLPVRLRLSRIEMGAALPRRCRRGVTS